MVVHTFHRNLQNKNLTKMRSINFTLFYIKLCFTYCTLTNQYNFKQIKFKHSLETKQVWAGNGLHLQVIFTATHGIKPYVRCARVLQLVPFVLLLNRAIVSAPIHVTVTVHSRSSYHQTLPLSVATLKIREVIHIILSIQQLPVGGM